MGRTIIIGGGAIGLSVAYHLAHRGASDVLLLERNQLTSGTSWHAAGIVGPLRATPNMTRLASYALDLFPNLEAETGMATGYRQTGGYWLARREERLDELHRISALGRHFGLNARVIGADEVHVPGLDVSGHAGAMWVAEDANVNPVDLCMAYARAARSRGVEIRENCAVAGILAKDGTARGVALADGTEIEAQNVVICAGAWSKPLAKDAGLHLPLQAVEHMYVVTEPMPDLPHPFPVIRDMDTGIYIKGDAGKLVIGGFEPDAKVWDAFGPEGNRPFLEMPEDWDQFTPFMEAALDLVPALSETGIQHFMNGPESFTNDTRPLVGAAPEVDGLYVAAGMNSVGIMSSAGIGRVLADWIVDGEAPMDLWEVDVTRADPRAATDAHMADRMAESVADLMAMHWPFKQPRAGRGLRKSALHEAWADQGAVFGLTAGWERGLWYAETQAERDLPYSVGAQPWYPIARREAARMEGGAVLLDLSPFTKIHIGGPDAERALMGLTCRSFPADRTHIPCVLAPILNDRGGIEIDATILRIGHQSLRMTTPAATRWRDLAYLRRALRDFDVTITDQTDEFQVIGVMGAASRDLLQGLSGKNLSDFPFGTAQKLSLAGRHMWVQRLSFVGELGWEIWAPTTDVHKPSPAPKDVFDALIAGGARPMGHYAVDACRLEKGFLHWGHDIGPEVTPLEAGLGFTVDWNKEFTGKAALEAQRAQGLTRRLCLFQLEGEPLILHDEPILEGGRVVGLTTSGAKGARTGLTLALGMIEIAPGEKLSDTCAREFSFDIAGKTYPARALPRAPFDPKGERMRG